MFVMVDRTSSFYNSLNMFYVRLMMVAPMVVLKVLAMKHMFPSRAANAVLIAGSLIAFFGSFALIRAQTTIGHLQFARSMIPHHSGTTLMCEQAKLSDPELLQFCQDIIRSQRQEIGQLEAWLERL